MQSQGSAAYLNDQKFFFGYQNEVISRLEFMPVQSYHAASNYIAYIDNLGNFKVFTGLKKYQIFPLPPQSWKASNFLLAYTMGDQLGVFNGIAAKKVETFITPNSYKLGDSVLAYVDNFNFLKAYVLDTTIEIMPWSGEDYNVSENLLVYQLQNSEFRILYHQKNMLLDYFAPTNYKLARNIVAFNNYKGYFKVFDKGKIFELESYEVHDYEVGNDIVFYTNNIGEWIVYSNGEKHTIQTIKPKKIWNKRNMLAYLDPADRFIAIDKGEKIILEQYAPQKVEIWDNMIVYQDLYGKLYGYVGGKKIDISSKIALNWSLQNSCVYYYDQNPALPTIWHNGKEYQYSPLLDIFNKK